MTVIKLSLPVNVVFKCIISSSDYEKTEDRGGGGTEKGTSIHVALTSILPTTYEKKKHVDIFAPLPSSEQKR